MAVTARAKLDAEKLRADFPIFEHEVHGKPLSYLDFVQLMTHAVCVLTDSGGIQEETTALGTPCLTLRTTTERPITVTQGTNRIVGTEPERIAAAWTEIRRGEWPRGRRPELWDGRSAERIVKVLMSHGSH